MWRNTQITYLSTDMWISLESVNPGASPCQTLWRSSGGMVGVVPKMIDVMLGMSQLCTKVARLILWGHAGPQSRFVGEASRIAFLLLVYLPGPELCRLLCALNDPKSSVQRRDHVVERS